MSKVYKPIDIKDQDGVVLQIFLYQFRFNTKILALPYVIVIVGALLSLVILPLVMCDAMKNPIYGLVWQKKLRIN